MRAGGAPRLDSSAPRECRTGPPWRRWRGAPMDPRVRRRGRWGICPATRGRPGCAVVTSRSTLVFCDAEVAPGPAHLAGHARRPTGPRCEPMLSARGEGGAWRADLAPRVLAFGGCPSAPICGSRRRLCAVQDFISPTDATGPPTDRGGGLVGLRLPCRCDHRSRAAAACPAPLAARSTSRHASPPGLWLPWRLGPRWTPGPAFGLVGPRGAAISLWHSEVLGLIARTAPARPATPFPTGTPLHAGPTHRSALAACCRAAGRIGGVAGWPEGENHGQSPLFLPLSTANARPL